MKTQLKQHNPSILTSNSQSSTVDDLYAKFENLKQRIINTDTRRSSKSNDRKVQFDWRQKDNKFRKIGFVDPLPLSLYVEKRIQTKFQQENNVSSSNNQNDWKSTQKNILDEVLSLITQRQQTYTGHLVVLSKKLSTLESKLSIAQQLIRQRKLQDNMIKINSSFTENPNNTTRCHTLKSLSQNPLENRLGKEKETSTCIIQMQKKHQQQIKSLVQSYQLQISKLILTQQGENIKHLKDTGSTILDSFHSQTIGKTHTSKLLEMDSLLFAKQNQINQLQTDNKKLKKIFEQAKIKLEKYSELNKILKQDKFKLQSTIAKFQLMRKVAQDEKISQLREIDELKNELKIKVVEMKKLKDGNYQLVAQLQSCGNNTNNETKQSKDTGSSQTIKLPYNLKQTNNEMIIPPHLKAVKFLELQNIATDRSEVLDQTRQKQQHINMLQLQLQQTQIQKIRRSRSFVLQRSLLNDNGVLYKRKQKELMDEISLLEEENHMLKQKKDKFQSEIKKAENDEDMMQQQLCRLNQQIRRLNAIWQNIDDCAYKLFKGEQLKQERIQMLEKESRLRQQFYKKKDAKKRGFSIRR